MGELFDSNNAAPMPSLIEDWFGARPRRYAASPSGNLAGRITRRKRGRYPRLPGQEPPVRSSKERLISR